MTMGFAHRSDGCDVDRRSGRLAGCAAPRAPEPCDAGHRCIIPLVVACLQGVCSVRLLGRLAKETVPWRHEWINILVLRPVIQNNDIRLIDTHIVGFANSDSLASGTSTFRARLRRTSD